MRTYLARLLSAICPYNDKECPKLEDVRDVVADNASRLANVEKLLYLIIGIITIELGVQII